MDLNSPEPEIEGLTRFQSLEAGHYWRATQDIPEEAIKTGTVLLIQSIRWVENAAHTIILRPHPLMIGKTVEITTTDENGETRSRWFQLKEHRFLVDAFLAKFEFEPDHKRFRDSELADVQSRITALQQEMVQTQSSPSEMMKVVEIGLRERADKRKDSSPHTISDTAQEGHGLVSIATGTVADALSAGITSKTISRMTALANQEHQIAEIKAGWIKGMTTQIAETVAAMTPFYEEQAAAALAQTEEVRTYVARLTQGIASLELYIGKDVEVTSIREGEPAPQDVPLSFIQAKLLMDEELAVWADVDEHFDFSKEGVFLDALEKHDGLVTQIFPTERCVVVMASTRRYIDYGDSFTNMARNQANSEVFLLVRNGMNIYKVVSPVESHLGTARLFPTPDDQEGIFRGMDGTHIKFEDVAYTDKLAIHEKFALHYKRFLLLACGLDHRLKLFGHFYPGPDSFDFLSLPFQERYFRFIHNDDTSRMLGGDTHLPVSEWITEKNAFLRSGSRVLCSWANIMSPRTAPSACFDTDHGRTFERRYKPKDPIGVAIAFKNGDSICVEVEVSGLSSRKWDDRTFNCKVTLSKNGKLIEEDVLGFLCLDAVSPDDLRWYIFNRQSRVNHLSYIRFFKRALKFVESELADEADARARLLDALNDGGIGLSDGRKEIVDQAVIAWRAAQRGKPLPKFTDGQAPGTWKSLLDQLYMLAGEGRRRVDDVQAFLESRALSPLRLVLSGSAKLVVYAAPTLQERDDRVQPHVWVHRITLETTKTGYIEKSRRWSILPANAASETLIHQWSNADEWIGLQSAFESFEAKQTLLSKIEGFRLALKPFALPMDADRFDQLFGQWRNQRENDLQGSRYVVNPILAIPIAIVLRNRKDLYFLCVGSIRPHVLLHRAAPDEGRRANTMQRFLRSYKAPERNRADFLDALDEPNDWTLLEAPVSTFKSQTGMFLSGRDGGWFRQPSGQSNTKLLNEALANWEHALQEKKVPYCLAPTLVDEHGPTLDGALGLTADEGYQPCRLWSFQTHNDDPTTLYPRWFDILSCDPPPPKRTGNWWDDAEADLLLASSPYKDGHGHSRQMMTKPSIRSARRTITEMTEESLRDGWKVVQASELPKAPQPPDGVERWYLVKSSE